MSNSIHHSFDIDLASEYGIEEAILIHHVKHWIVINMNLNKNEHDGRFWMYQTTKDINAHFYYMTEDKIKRSLNRLVKLGVLLVGNFNKTKFDRTKWYAFKDQEEWLKRPIILDDKQPEDESKESPEEPANDDQKTDSTPEEDKVINNNENTPQTPVVDPLGKMHNRIGQIAQSKVQNALTIPNTKTNTKTNTNNNKKGNSDLEKKEGVNLKPNFKEIELYVLDNNLDVSPEDFFNFYENYNWQYKGETINWTVKINQWHAKKQSKPLDYRKMSKDQKKTADEISSLQARRNLDKQEKQKKFFDNISFHNASIERIQELLKFSDKPISNKDRDILLSISNSINKYSDVINDEMLINVLQFKFDDQSYYTPRLRNLKMMIKSAVQ